MYLWLNIWVFSMDRSSKFDFNKKGVKTSDVPCTPVRVSRNFVSPGSQNFLKASRMKYQKFCKHANNYKFCGPEFLALFSWKKHGRVRQFWELFLYLDIFLKVELEHNLPRVNSLKTHFVSSDFFLICLRMINLLYIPCNFK